MTIRAQDGVPAQPGTAATDADASNPNGQAAAVLRAVGSVRLEFVDLVDAVLDGHRLDEPPPAGSPDRSA